MTLTPERRQSIERLLTADQSGLYLDLPDGGNVPLTALVPGSDIYITSLTGEGIQRWGLFSVIAELLDAVTEQEQSS